MSDAVLNRIIEKVFKQRKVFSTHEKNELQIRQSLRKLLKQYQEHGDLSQSKVARLISKLYHLNHTLALEKKDLQNLFTGKLAERKQVRLEANIRPPVDQWFLQELSQIHFPGVKLSNFITKVNLTTQDLEHELQLLKSQNQAQRFQYDHDQLLQLENQFIQSEVLSQKIQIEYDQKIFELEKDEMNLAKEEVIFEKEKMAREQLEIVMRRTHELSKRKEMLALNKQLLLKEQKNVLPTLAEELTKKIELIDRSLEFIDQKLESVQKSQDLMMEYLESIRNDMQDMKNELQENLRINHSQLLERLEAQEDNLVSFLTQYRKQFSEMKQILLLNFAKLIDMESVTNATVTRGTAEIKEQIVELRKQQQKDFIEFNEHLKDFQQIYSLQIDIKSEQSEHSVMLKKILAQVEKNHEIMEYKMAANNNANQSNTDTSVTLSSQLFKKNRLPSDFTEACEVLNQLTKMNWSVYPPTNNTKQFTLRSTNLTKLHLDELRKIKCIKIMYKTLEKLANEPDRFHVVILEFNLMLLKQALEIYQASYSSVPRYFG